MAPGCDLEVVVTTYTIFRKDLDSLNDVRWLLIVADEAHVLRSPRTAITRALKAIHTKHRIALTGTAMANSFKELWCLLDWAWPGVLGTAAGFERRFGAPIKCAQAMTATLEEIELGHQRQQELIRKMQPFFLRR